MSKFHVVCKFCKCILILFKPIITAGYWQINALFFTRNSFPPVQRFFGGFIFVICAILSPLKWLLKIYFVVFFSCSFCILKYYKLSHFTSFSMHIFYSRCSFYQKSLIFSSEANILLFSKPAIFYTSQASLARRCTMSWPTGSRWLTWTPPKSTAGAMLLGSSFDV